MQKTITNGADGTVTWTKVADVKCQFDIINSIELARESRGYVYALVTIRNVIAVDPTYRVERRGEIWDQLGAPVPKGNFLQIRLQRQVAM